MGKKYVKTDLDLARDELYSHIQRCGVLEATEEDAREWLADTLEYMAERYPQLSGAERKRLETMAHRYIKPIVPHGKETTAENREEWQEEREEGTEVVAV